MNMLRANVDSLERERAMLEGRGCSMSSSSGPINVDVNFDRSRHGCERERREPVQPIEAVTRDSRYGLRATRVGEASHPGPPEDVPMRRMIPRRRAQASANRFLVLSSDDEEEWVPATVPASSGAIRRVHRADQEQSDSLAVGVEFPRVARRLVLVSGEPVVQQVESQPGRDTIDSPRRSFNGDRASRHRQSRRKRHRGQRWN